MDFPVFSASRAGLDYSGLVPVRLLKGYPINGVYHGAGEQVLVKRDLAEFLARVLVISPATQTKAMEAAPIDKMQRRPIGKKG